MTEKEKMLASFWYKASDDELAIGRMRAKELMYDYNLSRPSDVQGKYAILKELLGSCGKNCTFEQPFHCDYGTYITIGENFFANYNCVMLDCANITIGKNVLMGPNVSLYTAGHPLHAEDRITELENAFPITIGDDVWIGGSATILGNVTIGNNVVVAAGSIVTKDVPSNVIVAGNPARIIREITEDSKIGEIEGF